MGDGDWWAGLGVVWGGIFDVTCGDGMCLSDFCLQWRASCTADLRTSCRKHVVKPSGRITIQQTGK